MTIVYGFEEVTLGYYVIPDDVQLLFSNSHEWEKLY